MTPAEWYAQLLALSGDANTMGLECTPTPKMSACVGMFGPRGSIASIYEPDYGPFFAAAVDIVDDTCDQYVPL